MFNLILIKMENNNIKFPKPKEIDYSKFIEPKKVVLVTIKGGITIANLISN